MKKTFQTVFGVAAVAAFSSQFVLAQRGNNNQQQPQQGIQRAASMVGGGSQNSGKCTAEVSVDGSAEVEIRGTNGVIRNLAGQPPSWRRLECTGALPSNPQDFRFRGIDGRGNVQLVRDPANGGAAVIRIDDPDGGAEGYTFEVTWGQQQNQSDNRGGFGGGPVGRPNGPENYPQGGQDRGGFRADVIRQEPLRFDTQRAVDNCRRAISQEAGNRLRARNVQFRDIRLEDRPGRRDRIVGSISAAGTYGQLRYASFSCQLDFDNGRVQSVQVEPWSNRPIEMNRGGDQAAGIAVDRCRAAAVERLRQDGYDRIQVGSIRVDDRPGREDWVMGNASVNGRFGIETLDFSCSVNLRDGNVRSVDVVRR